MQRERDVKQSLGQSEKQYVRGEYLSHLPTVPLICYSTPAPLIFSASALLSTDGALYMTAAHLAQRQVTVILPDKIRVQKTVTSIFQDVWVPGTPTEHRPHNFLSTRL